MRTITITQAEKAHHPNQLHDQLIAAGIAPLSVENTDTETRITVANAVTDESIQAVVDAHVKLGPEVPFDWKVNWQSADAAIANASTLPALKSAVANLSEIVKRMVSERVGPF